MKWNKSYLFISISSIALVIVLIIQFNWIIESARVKEAIFNDKATMVLSRTTEELMKDEVTCKRISDCIESDTSELLKARLVDADIHKIDSLFIYYMNFYNLKLDYKFVLLKDIPNTNKQNNAFMSNSFYKPMDNIIKSNGLTLKLILPDKTQFILAEMGAMFITSVVLIFIVLLLFWRTMFSLLKEKKIAEHTNDFLNNMTHEFKTPLTNIALASKLLIKEIGAIHNEKMIKYTDVILSENEKLSAQVENVLNMSALERGEINLNKEIVDINSLLQDVFKSMSVQLEKNNSQYTLNLNTPQLNISADKIHLNNAFCNLIDNAIKYNAKELILNVRTRVEDNFVVIEFIDNGIGIENAYHKKIFENYFRVPTGNVHNVKGFGLGLAYVKNIVELHQGFVSVDSGLSKGTTVSIKLPN